VPREILAAVCAGKGAPPVIEPVWLDDPLPHEMVIELGAAGICHTDLGIVGWLEHPAVLGHEGAGTVVEVGSDVTGFKPGDRVVATFGSCGTCRSCRNDHPAYCADHVELNITGARGGDRPAIKRIDGTEIAGGFFQQSSFATHALVTDRNAVHIPDTLDFVTAAPLGCGIQTGAGAVINNFAAKPGQPLLVIGCGAVGLSAIMAGKISGCSPIIATDLYDSRLEMAGKLGADATYRGDSDGLLNRIRSRSSGGVTYALDTAGAQQTFELAIASLHPGGAMGVLTLPGGFEEPVRHPGGMSFMNTSMIGIIEGDSIPDKFIPWLVEQNAAGTLPYEEMIKTYPFADIAEAFADFSAGKVIKPVLTFS